MSPLTEQEIGTLQAAVEHLRDHGRSTTEAAWRIAHKLEAITRRALEKKARGQTTFECKDCGLKLVTYTEGGGGGGKENPNALDK